MSGLYTVVIADAAPGSVGKLEIESVGYQIIGVSLLGDAFIGFLQEYTMKSMLVRLSDMMAGVYTFASVLVLAAIVARGRTGEYFALVQDQPDNLLKPLIYGWLSYIGNCFVQTMIGHYGVLLTVSCLNVRQVRGFSLTLPGHESPAAARCNRVCSPSPSPSPSLALALQFSTIMASYRGFGSLAPKPFAWPQQVGTALVFAGILVNLSFKQRSKVRALSAKWFKVHDE